MYYWLKLQEPAKEEKLSNKIIPLKKKKQQEGIPKKKKEVDLL